MIRIRVDFYIHFIILILSYYSKGRYRINWITPPPRVTTPFGLYPQVQIEKNGSPGIYPHGVILSILQLYHILIGHVQVTINLLIEVIVVIRGVKSSLRAFVILAILAIAIVAIA